MCLAKRFCKLALQTFHAVLEERFKEWCCARVYFESFCKGVLQECPASVTQKMFLGRVLYKSMFPDLFASES